MMMQGGKIASSGLAPGARTLAIGELRVLQSPDHERVAQDELRRETAVMRPPRAGPRKRGFRATRGPRLHRLGAEKRVAGMQPRQVQVHDTPQFLQGARSLGRGSRIQKGVPPAAAAPPS